MGIKKQISNTVGVVVGGVGISEANKIPQYGNVIGTSMGAGMAMENLPTSKKKKGGWF